MAIGTRVQDAVLSVNVPRGLEPDEYNELAAQSERRVAEIKAVDGATKTPSIERLISVHKLDQATATYLAEIALQS